MKDCPLALNCSLEGYLPERHGCPSFRDCYQIALNNDQIRIEITPWGHQQKRISQEEWERYRKCWEDSERLMRKAVEFEKSMEQRPKPYEVVEIKQGRGGDRP
jgi:hypothetical protein